MPHTNLSANLAPSPLLPPLHTPHVPLRERRTAPLPSHPRPPLTAAIQVVASGVRWLGEDYSFRSARICAGKCVLIHLQLPRARCRRRHPSVLLRDHRAREGQESEADEDVQVRS